MTQEQKELLLKDLCARLPYGVKLHCYSNAMACIGPYTLNTIVLDRIFNEDTEYVPFDEVKPYLFPLSSMTEEQCHEFYCRFVENEINYDDFKEYYFDNGLWHKVLTSIDDCSRVIDWCNKNHFDYNYLIDDNLALDATNLNIY